MNRKHLLALGVLVALIVAGLLIWVPTHHSHPAPTTTAVTTTAPTPPSCTGDKDDDCPQGEPDNDGHGAKKTFRTTDAPGADKGDSGGLRPKTLALTNGVTGCGTERAAVKHLTDGFTLPTATTMTVEQLLAMTAPAVTQDSARFPQEQTVARLVGVHVIAAKQEADSDLHIILTGANGAEMNVESPQAACDSASPYAAQLAKARAAIDAAMPNVSSMSYTPENLTATIEGPIFFDVLHGQRGAANGVEIHPVTSFTVGSGPPVTTTPTTTATPTTVPTTTSAPTTTSVTTTVTSLRGCVKYPGRIFFHHKRQNHCAAGYFTTP